MSKLGVLIATHKLAAGLIIGTVAVGGTTGGVVTYNHVQEVKAENIAKQKEITRIADLHDDAKTVDSLITKIGNVTLDSETAINTADNAFNKLSKEGQKFVKNADVLTKDKATLKGLKDQLAIDQGAAKAVTDKITAIGDVTLDKEATITDARTSFNALTDTQKSMVTNADTLTAAETSLQGLKSAKTTTDKKTSTITATTDKKTSTVTAKTNTGASSAKVSNGTKSTSTKSAGTTSTASANPSGMTTNQYWINYANSWGYDSATDVEHYNKYIKGLHGYANDSEATKYYYLPQQGLVGHTHDEWPAGSRERAYWDAGAITADATYRDGSPLVQAFVQPDPNATNPAEYFGMGIG